MVGLADARQLAVVVRCAAARRRRRVGGTPTQQEGENPKLRLGTACRSSMFAMTRAQDAELEEVDEQVDTDAVPDIVPVTDAPGLGEARDQGRQLGRQ